MRKKWNQEEVNFLIENYNLKGVKYCCDFLQRTKDAVVRKATKLKISDKRKKSKKAYS